MPSKHSPLPNRWARCKKEMREWDLPKILKLMGEMYDLSADNRRFLEGRLLSERSVDVAGDLKAVLKRKISPSAVYRGDFRHIELKRMIDQFARAVYDPAMVADVGGARQSLVN